MQFISGVSRPYFTRQVALKHDSKIITLPANPATAPNHVRAPDKECVLRAMGGLLYLTQGSRLHRKYAVDLLLRRVGPCLQQGSFRYYEENQGGPVAFCCWVFLSDRVWLDVRKTGRELKPSELNSGSKVFFLEFLAPFGHTYRVIKDLKRHVFPPGAVGHGIRGASFDEIPEKLRIQKYSSRVDGSVTRVVHSGVSA